MPTPTQYFGYAVTNLGPLTTRFTPAPACATTKPNVYIETQLAETRALYGYPSCGVPKYEGRLPSGKALDDLNSRLAAHPYNGNLVYYSPGLKCPSGWKKAGAVVGGHGQATRHIGVFTGLTTATLLPNRNPEPMPKLRAYADILDPGEALVWCCPEGFQANADAMCTSDLGPLSSFSYTQRCEIYLPTQDLLTVTSYQGTLFPNPLIIVTAVVTGINSSTFTIAASETPGLTVVSAVPAVALLRRLTDEKANDQSATCIVDVEDGDSASLTLRPSLLGVFLGTIFTPWTLTSGFQTGE